VTGVASRDGADPPRLEAHRVEVQFGGLKALDGVDVVLDRGRILGLIGPNGAGKTTLVNVLSGFQRPRAGSVRVGGVDVTRWSAHRRARRGLARTFQGTRLFGDLTVRENVEVAALGVRASTREARAVAAELLVELRLERWADAPAASLPFGGERRVEIARALAARPRFLLLDEPAAGLNEAETDELAEVLRAIQRRIECGLLVIEHDMPFIMRLCHEIQVLDYGKTIALGTPDEIRTNAAVLEAYLGAPAEPRAEG
jgi:branched-chain amino acid transport system ATP-binding protein